MARLGKEAWEKSSLKTTDVEVPELGGEVHIRELPAEYSAEIASHMELRQVGRDQIAKVDTATMERLQFAYGVIGEGGEPLFTETEAGELARKHGRAFKTVIAAIDDLSGVDKEAIEKAEARFPSGGGGEAPAANGRADVAAGTGKPDVHVRAGVKARDAAG